MHSVALREVYHMMVYVCDNKNAYQCGNSVLV